MGGSGGGDFGGPGGDGDLARRIRNMAAQAQDESYETSVNQKLGEYLADFNNRDAASTRKILDEVKRQLADEIGGTVDLIFGGSVSRHTYLEGLSDTDALVLLEPDEVGRKSPERLKERFAQKLRDLFGADNVKVGNLAVTVTVREKEMQFLPAMREGDGYKIPGSDGRSWSKINPKAFAKKLTEANERLDGKLVPAIKVVKSIIAHLPKQQQLTGYHIESLAIEAFKEYEGPRTPKAMVAHFFEHTPHLVKAPIRDKTGQSLYVDEYLGPETGYQRRIVSQALERVHRKLQNADADKNREAWAEMVTDE